MKTKNKPARPSGGCKKYAQAITDYVLGEEIDVPKEELMTHLKECAKCRLEATNWQDFQNAVRVKEYHARPEVKAKWDNFLNELTAGKLTSKKEAPVPICQNHISPKGKIVSVEELFSGETDTVRETVDKHGIVNFDDLPAKSNLPPGIAYGAMVLLAQKNELCIVEHKDHMDLYLARP